MDRNIDIIVEKLNSYKISPLAQEIFLKNLNKLSNKESGFISSQSISPIETTDSELKYDNPILSSSHSLNLIKKVVVIKLNGGLGTSMGMKGAKSQLQVKDSLNFVEICVKQIEKLREISGYNVPLIFMNSFNTQSDTEKNLLNLNFENDNLPAFFIENKSPKLKKFNENDYIPASYSQNPELEWAPPGHADVYPSLFENGLLQDMKNKGYEYLFISNVDNLGATLDFEVVEKVMELDSPFVMEVSQRTENDKKGGHLAIDNLNRNYILRESAQVKTEDSDDFQNYKKYKFFNTNSIWIKIEELIKIMNQNKGVLDLPLIINKKNINPSDSKSEEIIQLESAMGSAISLFSNAKIILVPSDRFIPVKNTSNLLYLRSDLVDMDEYFRLHPVKNIKIDLNQEYYKNIEDFEKRFKVIPSLKNADSVKIDSDLTFDRFIEISGSCQA
jgi:UTP--glucose-1-phosphate uridylyltransferase